MTSRCVLCTELDELTAADRVAGHVCELCAARCPLAASRVRMFGVSGPGVHVLEQDRAVELITSGRLRWCRARILAALAGAERQGVLRDALGELVDGETADAIATALRANGWIPVDDFAECAACSAKAGAPDLCPACLHNRALVARLRGAA